MFWNKGVLNYYDHLNLRKTGQDVAGWVEDDIEVLTDSVSSMNVDLQVALEQSTECIVDEISTLIISQERMAAEEKSMFFSLTVRLRCIQMALMGGFTDMVSVLERMSDNLQALVRLTQTPNETAAMEHFVVARENFRKGLYAEALQRINYAISGDRIRSSGHPEQWRFHYLKGLLLSSRLAGFNDSKKAEECFLAAARYAQADGCIVEMSMSMLLASWMSYVQKAYIRSLGQCKRSLRFIPDFAEALYHKAKLCVVIWDLDSARLTLQNLIEVSPKHFLKVAVDDVFRQKSGALIDFFVTLRDTKKAEMQQQAAVTLAQAEVWLVRRVKAKEECWSVLFFQQFLENTPDDLVTLYERKACFPYHVSRVDEAVKNWTEIARIKTEMQKEATEVLARVEPWLGRVVNAETEFQSALFFQKFLENTPDDLVTLYERKASFPDHISRVDEAVKNWTEASRIKTKMQKEAKEALLQARPWLERWKKEEMECNNCIVFLQEFLKDTTIDIVMFDRTRTALNQYIAELQEATKYWNGICAFYDQFSQFLSYLVCRAKDGKLHQLDLICERLYRFLMAMQESDLRVISACYRDCLDISVESVQHCIDSYEKRLEDIARKKQQK